MSLRALSTGLLNTSRTGDSTMSLGSLLPWKWYMKIPPHPKAQIKPCSCKSMKRRENKHTITKAGQNHRDKLIWYQHGKAGQGKRLCFTVGFPENSSAVDSRETSHYSPAAVKKLTHRQPFPKQEVIIKNQVCWKRDRDCLRKRFKGTFSTQIFFFRI